MRNGPGVSTRCPARRRGIATGTSTGKRPAVPTTPGRYVADRDVAWSTPRVRQTRGVDHATSRSATYLPGVVGTAGRFPVDVPVAMPLLLAGHRVLTPGPLRIYTCGITPYDVTHVGHASTFVWACLLYTSPSPRD